MQARFIISKNFNCLSFTQQNVANCRILQSVIFCKIILHSRFSSGSRAFHQFFNISPAYRDRQKSYSCQNRKTSSHIIRNYERLIPLFRRKLFQCSLRLVCRSIDSLCGLFFSIFLFQYFFKNSKGNGWLCSSS